MMQIEEDFGYGEEMAKGSLIEKGHSYFVYNRNPGGALWTVVYSKEGSPSVSVQFEYKKAEGFVTPLNQEEVDFLTELLNSPKGDLCMSDDHAVCDIRNQEITEVYVTGGTYEGGNECFVYHEGWSEEDKAALEAEYINSPHIYRGNFLEAKGHVQDHYEMYLTDVVFDGGVEEIDDSPIGQYGFDDRNNDLDGEWNRWASESSQ